MLKVAALIRAESRKNLREAVSRCQAMDALLVSLYQASTPVKPVHKRERIIGRKASRNWKTWVR